MYCTEEIQHIWGHCVVTEDNAQFLEAAHCIQFWDTQMHISDNYPHKSLTKYYCLYAQLEVYLYLYELFKFHKNDSSVCTEVLPYINWYKVSGMD